MRISGSHRNGFIGADTKRLFKVAIFIILFASSMIADSRAGVTLTEVLANEPGKYVYLEWVEVYNNSYTDADISGWFLIEGGDTNSIPEGSLIPPKTFAVLSRHPISNDTSEMSFERYWGDSSGVWGDSPDENYPLFQVKMTLKNSDGSVILFNGVDSISGFTWHSDAGDGISFEKQDVDGPDLLSNWAVSSSPDGNTPGRGPGGTIIIKPTEFDIELEPEVVFLKKEQSVNIKLSVPEDYKLTLILYDINGKRLRTIFDEDSDPPEEYTFDCRDGGGKMLKGGIYIIYAMVEGSHSKELKKLLVVAGG